MKSLAGIVLGSLLAITIGCAAKSSRAVQAPTATAAEPGAMGAVPEPRSEIDRLDQAISEEMNRLALPRPTPAPLTCTAPECAQQMSTTAATATAPPAATCKPAQTQTCTDSCKLQGSICENAGKICRIAADLGGTDAYANDMCNSGNASCEAAKQRCCSCM
jgi:hypothetical protein